MNPTPFSLKQHGINDYALGAIQLTVPPLLHLNKTVTGLYRLFTVNFLLYNSITDHGAGALPFLKRFIIKSYFNLRFLSIKETVNFGLEPSNVVVERYPLVVTPAPALALRRLE